MDKRRSLYEKLKDMKITKLTLKQSSNKTITLNLKEDLLNENVEITDKVLNMLELIVSQNKPKKNESSQIQDKIGVEQEPERVFNPPAITATPIKVQHAQVQQQPQEAEEVKNQCRLCQLKCLNEKALVEHITRSHASSHSENRRRMRLHLQSGTLNDTCDSGTDLDTSFSQDDNISLPTTSESAKKQLKPHGSNVIQKPSVAIRVAKVAYYNTKDTLASSTAQTSPKANVFLNGIRGNFFSQERLPLKSCKIKIKKTGSPVKADSKLIDQSKINEFFKSLIDYIPEKVSHLDDIIHMYDIDPVKASYMQTIHKTLLNSKVLGLSLYGLRLNTGIVSMNMINDVLNILIKNHLVLPVGITERVYVSHEFCQPWIIFSYKNQKGRNYGPSVSDEMSAADDETETLSPTKRRKSKHKEVNMLDKQYKRVNLIPRPWRYIDGLLNRPVLQKMLESLILYLKSHPDSTFQCISDQYCPVLQPVQTLELLDMLVYLECVECRKLKAETKCSLQSDFTNQADYCLDSDSELGNELVVYECTSNAIFIVKQVFETPFAVLQNAPSR